MIKNNMDNIIRHLDGSSITLLDIGARNGIHGRWAEIPKLLNVFGFEPDTDECDKINENAHKLDYPLKCLPFALGNKQGESATLNLCKDLGCSSLYQPNMPLVEQFYYGHNMEIMRTLDVTINRLDDISVENDIQADAIKIDTQGYELEILKGSTDLLKNTKLVELEVEFNEQYKDQPLFSDIDLFMRSQGYALLGLRRTYWRRKSNNFDLESPFGGQIMHGDAIYYNEKLLNETESKIDVIKFCSIFSLYQQDDFISYLLTMPHKALESMPLDERIQLIDDLLNKQTGLSLFLSKTIDLIRKKIWLPHTALRRMLDKLQSKSAEDWHDPDFY
ncbi:MAG: FkbM family methyltransferase [Gammaproteobacteria bacterium]|nr:FkbM family methyltransferase [Gammaproteobacteria bacterium]